MYIGGGKRTLSRSFLPAAVIYIVKSVKPVLATH